MIWLLVRKELARRPTFSSIWSMAKLVWDKSCWFAFLIVDVMEFM